MKYLTIIFLFLGGVGLQAQITIDFTDSNTATYGTDAQKIVDIDGNGTLVAMMWAGDTNGDGFVRAKADVVSVIPEIIIPSDRDIILNNGLGGDVDGELVGYYPWDVNLDGFVRAKAKVVSIIPEVIIPSDRDVILNKALGGDVDGKVDVQY